jgi:hypothetical protein
MIAGWDPSKTYTGHALLDCPLGGIPDKPPPLLALEAVRTAGDRDKAMGKLYPLAKRAASPGGLWCVEVPPAKLRRDQHASHVSGAGPAWFGGMIQGWAWSLHTDTKEMQVDTWRGTALACAVKWGQPMTKPRLSRAASQLPDNPVKKVDRLDAATVIVHRACGHSHRVNQAYLVNQGPPSCPTCHAKTASRRPTADKRDLWKERACQFVEAFWPDQYERLVGPARARARGDKPDHQLSGVADACEAVGIALGALTR